MSAPETPGLGRAARLVADRAARVARLTVDLALAEMAQKLRAVGAGVGLFAASLFLVLGAGAFLLAAAAAALALVVPTWLALLIVGGAMLALALLLAAVGVRLFRKAAPPVPEQALEEARTTAEVLRHAG